MHRAWHRFFIGVHERSESYCNRLRPGGTSVIRFVVLCWAVLVLLLLPAAAQAQYFGRNKVQYRSFKFQVLKTEHFDIYYYPEEAEGAAIVGRMAERWRWRLTRFFSHDLRGRQALILYARSEERRVGKECRSRWS